MNHMQRREQLRGIALTIIGGIFWGLAGVCGQYLFEERGLTAKWLVSVRLVLAGLMLNAFASSLVLGKTKKADV